MHPSPVKLFETPSTILFYQRYLYILRRSLRKWLSSWTMDCILPDMVVWLACIYNIWTGEMCLQLNTFMDIYFLVNFFVTRKTVRFVSWNGHYILSALNLLWFLSWYWNYVLRALKLLSFLGDILEILSLLYRPYLYLVHSCVRRLGLGFLTIVTEKHIREFWICVTWNTFLFCVQICEVCG